MPALTTREAAERLATGIERARPSALAEIYAELFPETSVAPELSTTTLAAHVRSGLLAEELVDLWNVVFPADRNVWYDEQDDRIHYSQELVGTAEAD